MLAHEIDQAKPFAPECSLIIVGGFAQVLVDEVSNLGGFRASGMAVGGNDGFRKLFDERVLAGSEEVSGRFGSGGFRVRRGKRRVMRASRGRRSAAAFLR